jgi:hypothetical protein
LIYDITPDILPDGIVHEYIDKIHDIEEWNNKIVYNLGQYIETEFAMLIHDDGFVINPECWIDEFLDYDYIGAPWPFSPAHFTDIHGNVIRVGNSVSIRSKKLLDIPKKIGMDIPTGNEDLFICVRQRHIFVENGCKFADIDIAKYFSHECEIEEINGITPFAFHGKKGFFD